MVLTKNQLKDHHHRVTIFSKEHGKLSLTAYGTKSLKSKRLSHLETANVIQFSWHEQGEYATLQETDLKYAHSQIKEDSQKLDLLYLVLFVMNRILPEKEPEFEVYTALLKFLRGLQTKETVIADVEVFLVDILIELGFLDKDAINDSFDVIQFVEGLIGQRIKL